MRTATLTFQNPTLFYYDADLLSVDTPERLEAAGLPRVPCTVPGNVELDLERAGVLPELFYGRNILKLEEYELFDYWYRLPFSAGEGEGTNEAVSLRFLGVDTVAEYFLNGESLGRTENMFVEHEFDVTGKLRAENLLYVHIFSPVLAVQDRKFDTGSWGLSYNAGSVWLRKAPHSFGWDICPRALGGGIWREVQLLRRGEIEIENVYLHTLGVDERGAHLRLSYDLRIPPRRYHRLRFSVSGACGEASFSGGERVVFRHGTFRIDLPPQQVRLWNPVGYGEPHLYQVRAAVTDEKEETLAEEEFRFGIRTIGLDFDPEGRERKFLFRVNGTPILCKGSNWVPLDAFHARDRERLSETLQLFAESNCNMVRCWGGGVYEEDAFFDRCDELGLLVWQDFSMACNLYPSTREFEKMLESELAKFVLRARQHPSLACWCGDNECDLGMFFNGIDPGVYRVTRDFLPSLLFRFDPFRKLIPSSPFFSKYVLSTRRESDLSENHLWGPRDCFKGSFYGDAKAVFVSEIGYHGCPSEESIRKFIPPESLWPMENDDWMAHQTVPGGEWSPEWNRIKLMAEQVRELFGEIPDNLTDFSAASQISQAEALKFFVESTRLKKWERTGILWWNMRDCWPQFSDSVVDYYGEKKLAFSYLRRSQRPLCPMFAERANWGLAAFVGNDSNRPAQGSFRILDAEDGATLAEGRFKVGANENAFLADVRVSASGTRFFLLELVTRGERAVNHYVQFSGPLELARYRRFSGVLEAFEKNPGM